MKALLIPFFVLLFISGCGSSNDGDSDSSQDNYVEPTVLTLESENLTTREREILTSLLTCEEEPKIINGKVSLKLYGPFDSTSQRDINLLDQSDIDEHCNTVEIENTYVDIAENGVDSYSDIELLIENSKWDSNIEQDSYIAYEGYIDYKGEFLTTNANSIHFTLTLLYDEATQTLRLKHKYINHNEGERQIGMTEIKYTVDGVEKLITPAFSSIVSDCDVTNNLTVDNCYEEYEETVGVNHWVFALKHDSNITVEVSNDTTALGFDKFDAHQTISIKLFGEIVKYVNAGGAI